MTDVRELSQAIYGKDLVQIRRLLGSNKIIQTGDNRGNQNLDKIIFSLVQCNDIEILQAFVEHGVDFNNIKTEHNTTFLYEVCTNAKISPETLKYLLKVCNKTINLPNHQSSSRAANLTPLSAIISYGRYPMNHNNIKEFFDAGVLFDAEMKFSTIYDIDKDQFAAYLGLVFKMAAEDSAVKYPTQSAVFAQLAKKWTKELEVDSLYNTFEEDLSLLRMMLPSIKLKGKESLFSENFDIFFNKVLGQISKDTKIEHLNSFYLVAKQLDRSKGIEKIMPLIKSKSVKDRLSFCLYIDNKPVLTNKNLIGDVIKTITEEQINQQEIVEYLLAAEYVDLCLLGNVQLMQAVEKLIENKRYNKEAFVEGLFNNLNYLCKDYDKRRFLLENINRVKARFIPIVEDVGVYSFESAKQTLWTFFRNKELANQAFELSSINEDISIDSPGSEFTEINADSGSVAPSNPNHEDPVLVEQDSDLDSIPDGISAIVSVPPVVPENEQPNANEQSYAGYMPQQCLLM